MTVIFVLVSIKEENLGGGSDFNWYPHFGTRVDDFMAMASYVLVSIWENGEDYDRLIFFLVWGASLKTLFKEIEVNGYV